MGFIDSQEREQAMGMELFESLHELISGQRLCTGHKRGVDHHTYLLCIMITSRGKGTWCDVEDLGGRLGGCQVFISQPIDGRIIGGDDMPSVHIIRSKVDG